MNVQHCGRRDDHKAHDHFARPRPRVEVCVCDTQLCRCPSPPPRPRQVKQLFRCTGRLVVEGAPNQMRTEVVL